MGKDHIENKSEFPGLNVNVGVSQPSSLNHDAVKKLRELKRKSYNISDLFDGLVNGDLNSLSQAITLVESSLPEHNLLASEIIEKCMPYSGKSIRIGITGVPGVGKSSFIETLGLYLTRLGHKLAVLAIDPSSEISKGSILGDKTRMEILSADPKAFIRPSPSSGKLGGVARKTRETVYLCEAAGFDIVFIETVGVGQSETSVHSMVDFFLFLLIAGAGDELQGIKRGIMEMVDGLAINKADGDNIKRAELAKTEYQNALHLFPLGGSGVSPKVHTCSAINNTGIEEIWHNILSYIEEIKTNGYFQTRRNEQSKFWKHESINEVLKSSFYNNVKIRKSIIDYEDLVLNNEISSFLAGQKLLDEYFL